MGLFGRAAEAADCMYCGRPLSGENDGWAHAPCQAVVAADDAANKVTSNSDLDLVERHLRREGRCPWQIRGTGFDGPGVYCGRALDGDFCLEHQREMVGDEYGAADVRCERTLHLLAAAGLGEAI